MHAYNSYAIEVFDGPAGAIIQQAGGYRFFASTPRSHALDGRVFRNPTMAERAARRVAEQFDDRIHH